MLSFHSFSLFIHVYHVDSSLIRTCCCPLLFSTHALVFPISLQQQHSAGHVARTLVFNMSPVFQYIMKIYREQTMQISQASQAYLSDGAQFTHTLVHSCTHSLAGSFIHSLTHSVIYEYSCAVNMIKFLCFDSFWARLGPTRFSSRQFD